MNEFLPCTKYSGNKNKVSVLTNTQKVFLESQISELRRALSSTKLDSYFSAAKLSSLYKWPMGGSESQKFTMSKAS